MSKYVPVMLDKSRNLRYGMSALSKIEDALNVPVAKIDYENMMMKDLAVMAWAGLVHEDKDLTPEKVMDLIDDHSDLQTISETIGKALSISFGKNNQGQHPAENL